MESLRYDVGKCVNCGKLLGNRRVERLNVASRLGFAINRRDSSAIIGNVKAVVAEKVSVYEALVSIFGLGEGEASESRAGRRGDLELAAVCQVCSLVLHDLLRNFREFSQLRVQTSYLGEAIGCHDGIGGMGICGRRRDADVKVDGDFRSLTLTQDSGVMIAVDEVKVEVEDSPESISRGWEDYDYSHLYSSQVIGRAAVSPLREASMKKKTMRKKRMKSVQGGKVAEGKMVKGAERQAPLRKVGKGVGAAPKPTLSLQQPERTESLPDVNVFKKEIPSTGRSKNRSQKSLKQRQPKIELCEECQKTFVNTRYLKLHKLGRHEKVYECSRCQISVAETMLRVHYDKYHDGKPVLRFSCGSCSYQTHMSNNIKAHISRVHTFEEVKIKTEI
ncbi:unnamed protein product [Allacma fusca]|uniref:C2H2-type domain-containing protein n=1 Tax=Allacma fusca TaxID=39272 RepID=A0A8J2K5L0_9HEXA|nr:unnamed protein product [Allacma fusca]